MCYYKEIKDTPQQLEMLFHTLYLSGVSQLFKEIDKLQDLLGKNVSNIDSFLRDSMSYVMKKLDKEDKTERKNIEMISKISQIAKTGNNRLSVTSLVDNDGVSKLKSVGNSVNGLNEMANEYYDYPVSKVSKNSKEEKSLNKNRSSVSFQNKKVPGSPAIDIKPSNMKPIKKMYVIDKNMQKVISKKKLDMSQD